MDRSSPISLAASPDFKLGPLRIQPSLRRIAAGAREETVEPRVMQALIALAEADGAVVSRDALIDRCWDGRIVGEDAINRCIAKVRRLAESTEPPAFAIETVAKVGYRLKTAGVALPEAAPALPPALLPAASTQPVVPAQVRWWLLAFAGWIVVEDRPGARTRLPWRAAALALMVAGAALAAVVLVWRPDSTVVTSPAAPAASFSPAPHTVAVLAFANLSNDPAQEYLADGLAEAVIDVLSRVDQLRVTARTSSFTFKSQKATIEEIGRKLGVAAVLEGTLRRQGSHLRIDARLSDAHTGFPLWSQSYDRGVADLLKLQDEIAGDVAEALQMKLGDAGASGKGQGGTNNPLAFDAYLRGEQHLRAMAAGAEAAVAEFRTAIALDPDFALAQSRLAFVLVMISQYLAKDDTYRAMMAEARHAAERAIELAPGLGLAHANMAMVLRNEVTDMNAAWVEASRARALAPGSAIVETQYALIAIIVGHVEEAIKAAGRATELDPIRAESWLALGRVLDCARNYDAARDATERSMALSSQRQSFAVHELGTLLLAQGRLEEARQICSTLPDHGCMAIADHALGRTGDAATEMTEMISQMGVSGAYKYSEVYAQWHEPERARDWLMKAREINEPALAFIKCDAFQDPMRKEAWFQHIEQSLHFPPPEQTP